MSHDNYPDQLDHPYKSRLPPGYRVVVPLIRIFPAAQVSAISASYDALVQFAESVFDRVRNWPKMRFLCLHGKGTNSRIFESQIARIRYALDDSHEYLFVDGDVTSEAAPGIESLRSHHDELLRYVLDDDVASYAQVLQDVRAFVQTEGPFDGIVGFSEGGALAASLVLYYERQSTFQSQTTPRFTCAVFFCSGDLVDPDDVLNKNTIRKVDVATDGHVIQIPTAHIFSGKDDLYPGSGRSLSALCEPSLKEEYVHGLGHVVPGALSEAGVFEAARAIQRTIHRAATLSQS